MSAAALELLVLGAGPAYSDIPGSAGASYLVRAGTAALLLDMGQGTFPPLCRTLEPSSLEAVFVSHLHPDHYIDLIPFRHYLRRPGGAPARRVRLVAPAGIDDRIDALHADPGFIASAFEVVDAAAGSFTAGPFVVSSVRVTHAGESRAWRVSLGDGGPAITYTGDAGDPAELAALLRPGDLFLAEATLGVGPVPAGTHHLDGPSVGMLAAASGAGAVLVTHVRMGFDLAATVASVAARFAGPVALAQPGSRAWADPAGRWSVG